MGPVIPDYSRDHDILCRNRYQRLTPIEHCADCDLIHRARQHERSLMECHRP